MGSQAADLCHFLFLKVPPELRRQVYNNYLQHPSPYQDELVYENYLPNKIGQMALLLVNRQIHREISDLIRTRVDLTINVTWQGVTFDHVSKLCVRMKSKGGKWSLRDVPCLRLKVSPPHPERPTDIICLWFYARRLCFKLRKHANLQALTIDFMEHSILALDFLTRQASLLHLSWSDLEEHRFTPKRVLEKEFNRWFSNDTDVHSSDRWTRAYDPSDQEGNCDLRHILDMLSLIRNFADVSINLPASLLSNSNLQTTVQVTTEVMTKRRAPQFDSDAYVSAMCKAISCCVLSLVSETGHSSRWRLQQMYPNFQDMTEEQILGFQRVWPHLCCNRTFESETANLVRWDDTSWKDGPNPLRPCHVCVVWYDETIPEERQLEVLGNSANPSDTDDQSIEFW